MSKKCIIIFAITLFVTKYSYSQLDSVAKNLVDTLVSKIIDDDIPRKTFKDKFMYPHRWYIKQLLTPKVSDFDSTYITSNKRKLTITIPISKKFYGFNLADLDVNKKLKFSPNNYYHVGFNLSNVIITFGLYTGIKFGAKSDRGTTSSRDLQLTLIGRRVITDINYQNYKGFYVYNSSEYNMGAQPTGLFFIRPDIKVVSFGVNTMFVYNYKKYSLRGAFSFTDVQRKSVGSFMTGIYHSHVIFSSTDSTFTKYPFNNYFSPLVNDINKISVITVGISGGYGYTYVHKKIILSTAAGIGIGGQKTNYTTIDDKGHTLYFNLSAHVNAKGSIRYDNQRFFSGLLATYDNNFTFNSKLFNTESYIAKVVFFVGYRFNIKQNGLKMLKALGLVDYKNKK